MSRLAFDAKLKVQCYCKGSIGIGKGRRKPCEGAEVLVLTYRRHNNVDENDALHMFDVESEELPDRKR